MIRRLLYLVYFIINTDYNYVKDEINKLAKEKGKNRMTICKDILIDSIKYKSSFMDYFIFEFYSKTREEKESYVTTGLSYEFFQQINNKKYIHIFRDKITFNDYFKDYIQRDIINISLSKKQTFLD